MKYDNLEVVSYSDVDFAGCNLEVVGYSDVDFTGCVDTK